MQEHDQIGPLLDDVCALVGPALSATSMNWREVSETPSRSATDVRSVVQVAHASATVTIPTTDLPHYRVVSGQLTGGRRLLSDDILMLETLAVSIARRIDAIRLMRERHERERREQEIAKLATEAELRALRAQINPHFLFNALTTIGYLIQTAPPKALLTLMRLTALLRSVLRSEGEFTTLGRELEIVEAYLEIERARFEDRLCVRIDVPHALRAARMPPLLLQPLVENAVKHGVAPQRRGGQVTVSATLDRGTGDSYQLQVTVQDTGVGATADALERGRRSGLGLQNVERRLAHQFGTAASLDIRSSPDEGTTVDIRLPVPVWLEQPEAKVGS
jgi:LytS/YehU family sensor histidine kinase